MRVAVLVAIAAGCGRVGFDPVVALGDGGARDAPTSGTVYLISSSPGQPTDILTIDVATGHGVLLGQLPTALGVLGGLAWWDANTLYASGTTGEIVKVTLAPFGGTTVQNVTGNIGALENVDGVLVGIDSTTTEIVSLVPGSAPTRIAITGPVTGFDGGDLVMSSPTTCTWWNNTDSLFSLDLVTGGATPIGNTMLRPYVSGVVADANGLHLVSADPDDRIYDITAQNVTVASRPVCVACPTPYRVYTADTASAR